VVVTAGGSTDDFIYPPSAVTIPSREVSMRDYPGGANEDGTVLVAEQLDIVQSMEHAMMHRKALTAAARSPGARAHLEQFTWAAVTERLMEELGRAVAGTRGEHVAEAQRPGKKAKTPPAPRTRAVEDEDEEEDDEVEDEKEEQKGSDVTYDGWTKVIPAHSATSSIKVLSDLAALTSDGRGPRAAQAAQRHGATSASAPPGQGAKKAAKGGSVGSGGSGGSGNGPKKAKPHTPPARTKARRRRKKRPHAAVAAATDEL
jgi:hypothetical protein